jgi:hypothetical protein
VLLGRPAGRVVAEDPAGAAVQVIADEQGDDDQALHGGAQIAPDHCGEPLGLAQQRQRPALHLLVMLQLDLEQAGEVESQAQRARDSYRGELIAAEHLVHVPLGDHAPGSGTPVTGQDHATVVNDRDDGCPVRWFGREGGDTG